MTESKPEAGESTGYDARAEPSSIQEGSGVGGVSRPPSRRDPRADPDDEPSSQRVDVVTVDRNERPAIDGVTNAALTLRRELAKLHQQAAAVERTLEDQRRERTEAIERIEFANARAQEAEHRLELADAEIASLRRLHDAVLDDLQSVRSERDDLALAIENAKGAAEDLVRMRAEAERLREAHDAALKAATTYEAELGELRKREQAGSQKVTDGEAELRALRERLDRTSAELSQSRDEAAHNKTEVVRLRQETAAAAEAATKKNGELERELAAARDEVARLEKALVEARTAEEKLAGAEADLAAARVAAAEGRAEISRLERDVEAARHARDVSLERATMAEGETADVRKEAEHLRRELDAATTASATAATRTVAAERARSIVEESVKQLRDELTNAFARWRTVTPSIPPPTDNLGSVAPPAPPVSTAPNISEAPLTKRGSTSFPPVAAEARRLSNLSIPTPSPLPASLLDDQWMADSQRVPDAPASAPMTPRNASAPAPTFGESTGQQPAPSPPSAPSLLGRLSVQSIPPAVYPSVPPPAGSAPTVPPVSSVRPPEAPSGIQVLSEERDVLIEQLGDMATAREAAAKLLARADWLRGRPPVELLLALTHLDYDVEEPVFELARNWEREPICRALIASLRDEPDAKLREHGAWLLKHLCAPSAWAPLAELVSNESEPAVVRRWLLEAIERLVANRSIGWPEVGDLVGSLVHHPDSSLRDGAVGVVAALERSDDKRRVLLEILRTDDDEIVLSSAVQALAGALPIGLDPAVTERLLGHPSARVQQSVVDFVERSKRATAKS
jgi:hypothetical protein